MPTLSDVKGKGRQTWANYQALSPWRRYLVIGLLVLAGVYLAWCKYGAKPVPPVATVTAHTATKIASMARKAVTPRKVMVLTPKAEAVQRLHLDPKEADDPDEEIIEAVDVPPLPHGGTTVTFLNMSTGQPRTIITANAAPWFSFERGNTAGLGAALSTRDGQVYSGYYRRDLLQVKGVYVTGGVEANTRPEAKAGIFVEYRW